MLSASLVFGSQGESAYTRSHDAFFVGFISATFTAAAQVVPTVESLASVAHKRSNSAYIAQ